MIGPEPVGMGARPAVAHHLPDGRRGGRGHARRSCAWAGPRIRPFTFRTMVVAAGVARRDASRRRCCRSPSGSSGSSRRPTISTRCAATRPPARRRSSSTSSSRRRRRGAGHLVPGAQEHRRHPPDAAGWRRRARSSTTTSATPSASSTPSPPTASHFRELRDYVEAARSRLLAGAGRLEDRGPRRAGRADLHRVLDRAARRPAPRLSDDHRDAAGAEPRPAGRRHPDRPGARVSCA